LLGASGAVVALALGGGACAGASSIATRFAGAMPESSVASAAVHASMSFLSASSRAKHSPTTAAIVVASAAMTIRRVSIVCTAGSW
jgi:hypothetical protein